MNKLIIVLLAICLVSVHAFVKRDAADAPQQNGEDLMAKIQKDFASFGDSFKNALDPESIKKGFNDFVDTINKAVNSAKSNQEGPK